MDANNFTLKVEKSIQISHELNMVLDSYSNLTNNLKILLCEIESQEYEENEGLIEKILETLNQRDLIISMYNKYKNEYDELLTSIQIAEEKKIKELEEVRKRILQSIDKIESENSIRINHLFIKHQAEIKRINEGKRMHNAYEGKHPLAYGVFIDKKK